MFKLIKDSGNSRLNAPETVTLQISTSDEFKLGCLYFYDSTGSISKNKPNGGSYKYIIALESIPANGGRRDIKCYVATDLMEFYADITEHSFEVTDGKVVSLSRDSSNSYCGCLSEAGGEAYVIDASEALTKNRVRMRFIM